MLYQFGRYVYKVCLSRMCVTWGCLLLWFRSPAPIPDSFKLYMMTYYTNVTCIIASELSKRADI